MIDFSEGVAVPLCEVPQHLPPGRGGRRVTSYTLTRWCLHGVRGIRLESAVVGGRLHRSRRYRPIHCRHDRSSPAAVEDACRSSVGARTDRRPQT